MVYGGRKENYMSKKNDVIFEWNGFKIKKNILKNNVAIYKLLYLEVDKKGNSKQIILEFPTLEDAKNKYQEIINNGN